MKQNFVGLFFVEIFCKGKKHSITPYITDPYYFKRNHKSGVNDRVLYDKG